MPTNYNLSNISDISWGEPVTRYVSSVWDGAWNVNANSNYTKWIRDAVYNVSTDSVSLDPIEFTIDEQLARDMNGIFAETFRKQNAIAKNLFGNDTSKEVNVKEIEGESAELDTFLKNFQINKI